MGEFLVERHEDFATSLDAEQAADRVEEFLSELSRRPPNVSGLSGEVRAGSRAAYRFWGGWNAPGRDRLPMLIAWSTTPAAHGSVVAVDMQSDAG